MMTCTSKGLELLKDKGREAVWKWEWGARRTWTPPPGPTECNVWEKKQPLLETAMQETVPSGDSYVTIKGR